MIRDQLTATVWRRETMAETAARYREAVRRMEAHFGALAPLAQPDTAEGSFPRVQPLGGLVAARDHGSVSK